MKADLRNDIRQIVADALRDSKLEVRHIIDPSQCGFIVRRHFDVIVMGVLGFVAGSLLFATLGLYFYFHLGR